MTPPPRFDRVIRQYLGLAILLLLGGCSSGASLQGIVTYEGKEVEKGFLSLNPEDGKGPTMGTPIVKGRYSINNVVPGTKTVQITIEPANRRIPQSMEEARTFKPDPPSPDLPPPDALGNNQRIEVAAGAQQFDFHLKNPSK